METLKPCPFCGSEAELHQTHHLGSAKASAWFAWCGSDECPVKPMTNDYETYVEAVAVWNHRAERECEEIVFCKDCEWFEEGVIAGKLGKLPNQCLRPTYSGERLELSPKPDDFCSRGVRRGE